MDPIAHKSLREETEADCPTGGACEGGPTDVKAEESSFRWALARSSKRSWVPDRANTADLPDGLTDKLLIRSSHSRPGTLALRVFDRRKYSSEGTARDDDVVPWREFVVRCVAPPSLDEEEEEEPPPS